MMTLRLWRAMGEPPVHSPLFRRILTEAEDSPWEWFVFRLLTQNQVWLWSLLFVIDIRAAGLMIFSGTLYGIGLASRVSSQVDQERRSATYDLLCLSPNGAAGTIWSVWMACLHDREAFQSINAREIWAVRLVLYMPFIISAQLFVRRFFNDAYSWTIPWIVALLLILVLDHIQAITTAGVIGALGPHLAPNRMDGQLWAISLFVGFQAVTYGLAAAGAVILGGSGLLETIPAPYRDWLVPALTVMIFGLSREYILWKLWNRLAGQLNAAPRDLPEVWEHTRQGQERAFRPPEAKQAAEST
ncbi:MAG: hypothetical protein JNM70_07775 [Anaerolineae bacterium]|nr:hypothetical protein [Anaerolineae bacterium]